MNRPLAALSLLAILIALALSGDHSRARLAERGQPQKISCRMVELQILPDLAICSREQP